MIYDKENKETFSFKELEQNHHVLCDRTSYNINN